MITYSIIKKSQLEGTKRLDAEYYHPEYLELERKIKQVSSERLKIVAQVSGGKRLPVGDFFSTEGVPYLRIVDIYGTFVDSDYMKFISEKLHQKLKQYQIREKDILVTIVGNTVGLVGYNQLQLDKFNFTENCARVRAKDILPEYLLAILLSKVGQLQVSRERVGTAQPKLSLDRLRNFYIPIASEELQNAVKNTIQESLRFYEQSRFFYSQAESLLLEELGLKNFEAEAGLWSVVKLSETKKANRIDAEYFQPRYQKLYFLIRANKGIALGELATIKKGFEPGSEAYQEEGKLFIRVSSISKDGITTKDEKYLKDELYQKLKKDYEPKIGEILLTKDASPGTAFVVKEPIEGIISGGVLRVKVKEDIEPEYLALVINSIIGQSQVERAAGGSIIMHWKPDQVKELQIPILSKPTQQKIAELVKKSHEARKKAKELLESAKRKVEELIESRTK